MMKNTPLVISLFLLFIACLPGAAVMAQDEAESARGTLYIQSNKGGSDVEVPTGTSLSVHYRHDPVTYKGVILNAVLDSTVVLGLDTVGIRYIDEIGVRREKMHFVGSKIFLASVIVIVVFVALAFLTVLAAFNFVGLAVLLYILLILLSIPMSLAFPTGLIVGIVLMLSAMKHYNFYRDYKLSTRPRGKTGKK